MLKYFFIRDKAVMFAVLLQYKNKIQNFKILRKWKLL